MPIIKANALSEKVTSDLLEDMMQFPFAKKKVTEERYDYFQIIISMPTMPPALIRQNAQIE
jgi:hypothetical protein